MGESTGVSLSRAFYVEVVAPMLAARLPGVGYSAGRFGHGSDVLGLDDVMSRDHDWGLRLTLFVPAPVQAAVGAELERALPQSFRGYPTRFAFTGTTEARHHVDVTTLEAFLDDTLGFDPRADTGIDDWLSLTGQAVLEATAGPVFRDADGEVAAVRDLLAWYPDDVWRSVVAYDWIRIGEEMPLMGRAGDSGDDLGSRVIAARLVEAAMHLAFVLERRWPPYPKWFGTLFAGLTSAADLAAPLQSVLEAASWQDRQAALSHTLTILLEVQDGIGLPVARPAVVPFWGRPYFHANPQIASQLADSIGDPVACRNALRNGSIEQRTTAVPLLTNARRRRAFVSDN